MPYDLCCPLLHVKGNRNEEENALTLIEAYVVFPGNVGTNDTLRDLVASWAKQ